MPSGMDGLGEGRGGGSRNEPRRSSAVDAELGVEMLTLMRVVVVMFEKSLGPALNTGLDVAVTGLTGVFVLSTDVSLCAGLRFLGVDWHDCVLLFFLVTGPISLVGTVSVSTMSSTAGSTSEMQRGCRDPARSSRAMLRDGWMKR